MSKKIIDYIKYDIESFVDSFLKIDNLSFSIEPYDNEIIVNVPFENRRDSFKNFNDLLDNFFINGKSLKEQIDKIEFQ